jgi:excisionase family DNA binding protein
MDISKNDFQYMHEIMTVREVAEYLHLSEATVYQMARNGQIPVARIGKTWRFTKESINNWLSKSTEPKPNI